MDEISIQFFEPKTMGYPTAHSDNSERKAISVVSPFAQDSISPARPVSAEVDTKIDAISDSKKSAGIWETASSYLSYAWSAVFGGNATIEQVTGKSPSDVAIAKMDQKARHNFNKEISDMYDRISELDEQYKDLLKDNPKSREVLLMKLLAVSIRNQLNLKEESGSLAIQKIESNRKDRVSLHDDHNKIKEELEKLTGRCNKANIADKAVTAVAGVLFFATIGLNVSGLNLGSFNNYVNAINQLASLAKGGTSLFQAYTKGESEDQEKASYLLSAKQDLAQEKVTAGFDQLNQTTDDIANLWAILREIAEKQKNASSEMLSR